MREATSCAVSDRLPEALEFDYVIIGAGSAGCVLANRLSADGKNSVLLLEAGPKDRNIWIHVPLGYGRLFKSKTLNWMYQTEPEPGLDGRTVFQPRGKVLGGSSSINGLLYVRGQHEDYDRWRQRGNDGWGYDDVLPYFKKAENQQRGPDDFHGVGGPLPVSDLSHADPLSAAFIPTSTARPRKGLDISRPRRDTGEEQVPRSPIFALPRLETISTSKLRPWCNAFSSMDVVLSRFNTERMGQSTRRARGRRYWFPAVRTIRRNCCSSPA